MSDVFPMLKTTLLDSNVSIEGASMNNNSADIFYLHRMGTFGRDSSTSNLTALGIDGGFLFPLDGFTDGGMVQERVVSVSPF